MEIVETNIKGVWLAHSPLHNDSRGVFREWFKTKDIKNFIGHSFGVEQANISTSKKGVIRGIHFSNANPGQGKWVTCVSGSVWDVVVDIRPDSPTFKKWVGIDLDSSSGVSIFISEGLGHGFASLQDNSAIAYLLTAPHSPKDEFGIHPLDPELAINWPFKEPQLSEKDATSPTLSEYLGGQAE
jgi:dTDP-4-dehydrorhamnose 3,5-epimerase